MRDLLKGKLQGNERGYAFLITDGGTDYFIPHSDLKGAMHGDTVVCERTFGGGKRTTARVLKIIERGITELCGTFISKRSGGFVIPDDGKYFDNVTVPFGKEGHAKSGDKVVCEITAYPKKKSPEGRIVRVLGRQFDRKAELKSLAYTYNIPERFPTEVWREAEKLTEPSEKDFAGRRDFTDKTVFTIDGEDSRDFDDAVGIEKTENGNYRLYVHIADVSHYVKLGGIIDNEAFERATSVYFPESVTPMLPDKLCNDLCSLKEGVKRLTLSVVAEIDKKGDVVDKEITVGVIKSKARLTYGEVQKILDGDKETINRRKGIYSDLLLMNELTDILIKKRNKKGSIDLDVKESVVIVDKNGKIYVSASKGDKAHKIIEEFMILANVVVAEYAYYLELPFVYRIHEKPNEESLEKFYSFLDGLGITYKRKKDEVFPKDFQNILEKAKGTPAFTLINRVMLRSMQRAKYSPECVGHFGLSEKEYCHFTSPIRRYPDLCIHRILKDFLCGKKDVAKKYGDFVNKASLQSSEKERNAAEAERAVDDYYKTLYISDYVGETFDGVVSGVTGFGVFVELDNGIEGLIRIENIKGKRFVYDENRFSLSDGKTTYKLGDKVKITVVGADISARKAEFVFYEEKTCKNKRKVVE